MLLRVTQFSSIPPPPPHCPGNGCNSMPFYPHTHIHTALERGLVGQATAALARPPRIPTSPRPLSSPPYSLIINLSKPGLGTKDAG